MVSACATCKGKGYVWLGSQPYGSPGEAYAPCPDCEKGQTWTYEQIAPNLHARMRERCPVCGGLNPGDITHTRCASS